MCIFGRKANYQIKLDPLKSQMSPTNFTKQSLNPKPVTSRTTLKQTFYRYLKKLENGSKAREKKSFAGGLWETADPVMCFGGVCGRVIVRVRGERETGEN